MIYAPIEPTATKASAHAVFDRIWQEGIMHRDHAYQWAERAIGKGHIADMSPKECHRLIQAVKEQFPELFKDDIDRIRSLRGR